MHQCFSFRSHLIVFFQIFLIVSTTSQTFSSLSLLNTFDETSDAAQHCFKNGGKRFSQSKFNITNKNIVSYCVFDDGRKCNEWVFYKTGKCERSVGSRALLKYNHLTKRKK